MIPITIVTGYLGSGKTTLLNCILKQNHGMKIAVIENEFGEKNIDYEFVLHEKEQIFEMSNGCICCNVREDLILTLKKILEFSDKFNSIVIETTGVADPSPVLHTLKQDPALIENFEIDSIICLVDAKNFLAQLERSPEVKKQVTASNLIMLNKVDLVDDPCMLEKVENELKQLNPIAEIIKTTKSEIKLEEVFLRYLFRMKETVPKFIMKAKGFSINSNKEPTATHESGVSSKFIEFEGEIAYQFFSIWIDLLFYQFADNLYRMKGILCFKDEPYKVYFQAVHDYVEMTKAELWNENETKINQIVVIGKDLDFEMIQSGYKSCVK